MTESLFTSQTPAVTDASDGTPGISTATTVRFSIAGVVSGIRFYAPVTTTGTYTVELWQVTASDNTPAGTLLASKVMAGAPTGGAWNNVFFDAPVNVTTGVLYRAVRHNNQGRYVATVAFFGADLVNGHITADADGDDPVGLGVLRQGEFVIAAAAGSYPSNGNGTCYFVDVLFDTGPAIVNLNPAVATLTAQPFIPAPQPCPDCPPVVGIQVNLTAGNPFNAITGLASCVEQGLAGVGRPVCRACLSVPGAIAWDGCDCDCGNGASGQLAVTVPRMYPSRSFPGDASQDPNADHACGPAYLVAEVTIEVTRCISGLSNAGEAPSCAELLTSSADWWADVTAVRNALGCCLRAMETARTVQRFAMGQTVAKGPDGNCAGSETTVLVGFPNCICR